MNEFDINGIPTTVIHIDNVKCGDMAHIAGRFYQIFDIEHTVDGVQVSMYGLNHYVTVRSNAMVRIAKRWDDNS